MTLEPLETVLGREGINASFAVLIFATKKGYFGLNWVVFCYIYGITLGIKHFMLGISIVSVSKLQTIKVSV